MSRKSFAALSICLAAFIAGCASTPAETKLAPGHDECTVCKSNADLACVDLKIDASTPHAEYQGKTYYFCSDACRKDFLKDPAKYVAFKTP